MLDLLIKNASLPDGRMQMSVAVQDGRITAVEPGLDAPAHETLDAGGYLLSPPFVDPHFHMDATLSYGLPRINESGTLLEGIAVWGELKPTLKPEAIIERALTYCDWAVATGLLAIRSHVDTSDASLLAVDALLEVKKQVAPYIDLQLVAFPQDGVLRSKGAMRSRGLLPVFSPQALQEAEAARQSIPERHGNIRDLRQLTWFLIDSDDTRDLNPSSRVKHAARRGARSDEYRPCGT